MDVVDVVPTENVYFLFYFKLSIFVKAVNKIYGLSSVLRLLRFWQPSEINWIVLFLHAWNMPHLSLKCFGLNPLEQEVQHTLKSLLRICCNYLQSVLIFITSNTQVQSCF